MEEPVFVPFAFDRLAPDAMLARAGNFHRVMDARRSVRRFSADPVPRKLIELAIQTASTAPSGAHCQPWTFVAVGDAALKRRIRQGAEQVERSAYDDRMSNRWLADLAMLGTDWQKPFLETVPWLVVLFQQRTGLDALGQERTHYYVQQSVGIACGMFITAVHNMGLATLPYTPLPMDFLADILSRPDNERPFMILPVGYPAEDAKVPDLNRKPLPEVAVFRC